MTKKEFENQCIELERKGYICIEYIPNIKYASYVKKSDFVEIGKKK